MHLVGLGAVLVGADYLNECMGFDLTVEEFEGVSVVLVEFA